MPSKTHVTRHAVYLGHAFQPQQVIVQQAREALRGVKYDTLVATGLSGALVAPIVARSLRKKFMIVRKPDDGAHSERLCEGSLGRRWVILDDLIDSGSTFRRVLGAVEQHAKREEWTTEFVGAYLYDHYGVPSFEAAANLKMYR